eukprot:1442147-Rhodomonas_salina.2
MRITVGTDAIISGKPHGVHAASSPWKNELKLFSSDTRQSSGINSLPPQGSRSAVGVAERGKARRRRESSTHHFMMLLKSVVTTTATMKRNTLIGPIWCISPALNRRAQYAASQRANATIKNANPKNT